MNDYFIKTKLFILLIGMSACASVPAPVQVPVIRDKSPAIVSPEKVCIETIEGTDRSETCYWRN